MCIFKSIPLSGEVSGINSGGSLAHQTIISRCKKSYVKCSGSKINK